MLVSTNPPAVLTSPWHRGLLVSPRAPGVRDQDRNIKHSSKDGAAVQTVSTVHKLHIQLASPAPPLVLGLLAAQQSHALPATTQQKNGLGISRSNWMIQVCAATS